MADYVEYSSLATVPGPLTATGATEWGFALEANEAKLEALCQKVFAEPTGGEIDIRPLGHHVLFTLGRIEQLVSDVPPFDSMGWSPEAQIDIWIPAARVRQNGDHVVAEEFVMFMPYIWIDNTVSLPSGREMYGYPKAFGWALLPEEGSEETSFGLDVVGMNYDSDEALGRRPLVRIERGKHRPDLAGINFTELRDVGRYLLELVEEERPGLRMIKQLFDDVRHHRIRQVFLKQIRSIEDGSKAALQQVTEASYRILDIEGDGLDYEYECTIEHLDSHPLEKELGLTTQTTHLAFRTKSAFKLEAGRVLWP